MIDMFKYENIMQSMYDDEDEELSPPEKVRKLPAVFGKILLRAEDFATSADQDVSCNNIFGNAGVCPVFLAWDVLMRFLAELDVLTRVDYCDALESTIVNNLLTFLFTK